MSERVTAAPSRKDERPRPTRDQRCDDQDRGYNAIFKGGANNLAARIGLAAKADAVIASRLNYLHCVLFDAGVACHNRELLHLCLCDQQPVKGIMMVGGQSCYG